MNLYPLVFQPVWKRYLWGGRRLASHLGKLLPGNETDYAESWEIVDHADGQSVVTNGPAAGKTLHNLVQQYGAQLLGESLSSAERFPLLFKFLDCQRNLSVQVHPNDQQGAQLTPPDLGKTEAWVILAADPGSQLYAGLRQGVDRQQFQAAIERGEAERCLHRITPQVGDCVFIPAGTVHALGEGLVVAEIQQASNTTFRLFDWNRVDQQGRARPLHIQQGLDVTNFSQGPVALRRIPLDAPVRTNLVRCDKFLLDQLTLLANGDAQTSGVTVGGDQRFHILAVTQGQAELRPAMGSADSWQPIPLPLGQVCLLPASVTATVHAAEAHVLDAYLP